MSDLEKATQRLKESRQGYLTWQQGFDEWVKEQRAKQKARHVHAMEDAALAMEEAGASQRQIAQAYGTQERRTIKRLLERAVARNYRDEDTPARLG